jgi:hypothetical protein
MADIKTATARKPEDPGADDLVWGATAIGAVINRTKTQVHHLYAAGALDGAVAKLGHKTLVGSRRGLRNLPFRKSK